jgi:hypothetical protein
MPSTKLGPVFPTWRQAWDKDKHLRGILFRIDKLRELRSQGNFVLPSIPIEVDRAALKQCFDIVSTFVAPPVDSMIEKASSQLARVTRNRCLMKSRTAPLNLSKSYFLRLYRGG